MLQENKDFLKEQNNAYFYKVLPCCGTKVKMETRADYENNKTVVLIKCDQCTKYFCKRSKFVYYCFLHKEDEVSPDTYEKLLKMPIKKPRI